MANWYVSSGAYTSVTQWSAGGTMTVGTIRRPLTLQAAANQRIYRCTVAGTGNVSGGAEPTWPTTASGTVADNTGTWTEITGQETYQGTSWAAPHSYLMNAIASGWAAAGDTIFIDSAHAETQAVTVTYTFPGTVSSKNNLYSVTRPSSAIPPATADLATGAAVTTTGASPVLINGCLYCYGVTFNVGTGAAGAGLNFGTVAGTATVQTWDNCKFAKPGTDTGKVLIGPTAGATSSMKFLFRNTNFSFGVAGQGIQTRFGTKMHWWGGTVQNVAPTNLFGAAAPQGDIDCRDLDLSLLGAATFLVNQTNLTGNTLISFANCKINAALGGIVTGTIPGDIEGGVDFVISDSSGTVYREEHDRYPGQILSDTTNYRNAGASDGTTNKSWKFISNANCKFNAQLVGPDIVQWNSLTGSRTITLYIANTSGTLHTNDVGFEVEYLGSASTPQGTLTSSLAGPLDPDTTAIATDSVSTWAGLASPTLQKVTLTVTINLAGPIRLRPVVAGASVTVWIDPLFSVA